MKNLVKWFDDASFPVKIILALPIIDIAWVVYRIAHSMVKDNVLGLVLGSLLIVIGLPWLWLVDIIFIALTGKVFWID